MSVSEDVPNPGGSPITDASPSDVTVVGSAIAPLSPNPAGGVVSTSGG